MIRRFFAATIVLWGSAASASIVIGNGDTVSGSNDSAFDFIAIDLTNPISLLAGSYSVATFNYQFTTSDPTLGGSIQPFLATGSVPDFTAIAVGDGVTYTADGAFTSVAFGGVNSFTLPSTTTVYAGIHWDGEGSNRMPVGYSSSGSSFLRLSGAIPPLTGFSIGGGGSSIFSRTYDFSITVDTSSVPEPASVGLAGVGLFLAAVAARRRRQR